MNSVSSSFAHQPFPVNRESAIKAGTGKRIPNVIHKGVTLGILGISFALWRKMNQFQGTINKQSTELSALKAAHASKFFAAKSSIWNNPLPGIVGAGLGALGLISAKNSEGTINGLRRDLANSRQNHDYLSSEVNSLRRNVNLGANVGDLRTDVIDIRDGQNRLRSEV